MRKKIRKNNGKVRAIWRRKAIGSLNGIAWPQKGEENGHYPDNNNIFSDCLRNFARLLDWATNHPTKRQEEETYITGIENRHLSPFIQEMGLLYSHISGGTEMSIFLQKGKPIARWGRKAIGSPSGTAWLLTGGCDEKEKHFLL